MSEAIFVTGGTGYLGSYVISELMARRDPPRLSLLTRAKGGYNAMVTLLHSVYEDFARSARPS